MKQRSEQRVSPAGALQPDDPGSAAHAPGAVCTRCGGSVLELAPGGLCARCLLLLGLDDRGPWTAAPEPPPLTTPVPDDPGLGAIGPYRLVRVLGEGGMGIVYLAEQTTPFRRQVALKVMKPTGRHSAHVLARFAAERQMLASLNHDGISKIYDAGVGDDGRPYVAMEYVDGSPLVRFCDEHRLPVLDRLNLFLQVCAAIQHAHQKGVIHRDIKPSNVLVGHVDDRLAVKVIDFGIAKALQPVSDDDVLLTQTGTIVGTPEYMSPEQLTSGGPDVDTRTDVYALGVVLYELLVGVRPFEADRAGSSPLTLLEAIWQQDPPKLTARLNALADAAEAVADRRRADLKSLARQVRGELEWITLRALEKQPSQRYQSATELGADVERYLRGEPVLANRPSTMYRLRKLARRHRVAVTALAVVLVAIGVSAIVSTVSLVRVLRAEDRTRRQLVASLVAEGVQRVDAADPLTGLVYLVRALELERDDGRIRSHRIRIGETLQRSPTVVDLWRHEAPIRMLAVSPHGQVATGSTDGVVRIRELSTRAERAIRLDGPVVDGDFSRDGAVLVAGSETGRIAVWRSSDLQPLREFREPRHIVDLAVAPDASLVGAIFQDGEVRVWQVASGERRLAWRHDGPGRRVVFSPSGALVATAGGTGVQVWEMPSGRPAGSLIRGEQVTDLAFSRSGELLATAGGDFAARLWTPRTGKPVGEPMRHDGAVRVIDSVTFADDDKLLVTTGYDHMTRVWRVANRTPVGSPRISGSIPGRPAIGPRPRDRHAHAEWTRGPVVGPRRTGRAQPSTWRIDFGRVRCQRPLSSDGGLRRVGPTLGPRAGDAGATPNPAGRPRIQLAGCRFAGRQHPRCVVRGKVGALLDTVVRLANGRASQSGDALFRSQSQRRVFARRPSCVDSLRRW